MREAERLELPRGRMCGDMGNVNLIFDPVQNRIFNIDYDTMSHGYIGFDCAYLLATMAKMPNVPGPIQALDVHMHSTAYAGTAERARFFATVAEVLTLISQAVYVQPITGLTGRGSICRQAPG